MQEVRIGSPPLRLSILRGRPGDPAVWTPSLVRARLATAARVFRGLPISKLSNFAPMSLQVDVVREFADRVGEQQERLQVRPPLPSAREIDEADRALAWLHLVETVDDRLLVWARAAEVKWRHLERRFRLGERGLRKRYGRAILRLVVRLNTGT